jgi:imidazolonepropionase-like amidohydrolase
VLRLAHGSSHRRADHGGTDTTVINPRRGIVSPHTTVLIRDGRIVSVRPAAAKLPRGTRHIDGRGKYLIPVLWDAHTHIGKTGANSLSLLLANGITGIRDMGSNLAETLAWSREIATGRRAGPRIRTSGPMLEARSNIERMRREETVEDVDRQRIGVANPKEARAAVQALARAGVHQIKMRTTPDLATFRAVADEAAKRGLPFAAHPAGPLEEMIDSGLDSLEHFLTVPPLETNEAERRALFRRLAGAKLRVTNTFTVYRGVMTPYEQGRAILAGAPGDPNRKYICGYLLKDWAEQLDESRQGGFGAFEPMLPHFYRDFREMHEEGVALLAGSDAAVMFTYPGFSLHDQLELMAGEMKLAPMDVLRIATDGLPAYFGESAQAGAIEAGQAADLVLLDADPLAAIGNTRRIRGVMAQGRWFGRSALDRLLRRVERDSAGSCKGGSTAGRASLLR